MSGWWRRRRARLMLLAGLLVVWGIVLYATWQPGPERGSDTGAAPGRSAASAASAPRRSASTP